MNSKYPNISQSLLMLLLIIISMFIAGFIAGIIIQLFSLHHFNNFIIGLANLLVIGLFLLRAGKKTDCSYELLYPLKSFNYLFIIPLVITVIGLSIILSETDNIVRTFLPMPEFIMKIFLNLSLNSGSIAGSFFLLCIVAPVTEEFLFRGLILQSFLNQYSRTKAVIFSSLLFALLHLNPWQFAGAFSLGILFSWWFINFKSLIPCMIGHALFNSFPIFFTRIYKINIKGYSTLSIENNFQPIWFDLTGLALIFIGIFLSVKLFKKNITPDNA